MRIASPPRTYADAVDRYVAEYSNVYHRPSTRGVVRNVLQRFGEALGRGMLLGRVALAHAERLHADLAQRVAHSTANKYLNHLVPFFTWCVKRGWIKRNPVSGARRFKITRRDKGRRGWENDRILQVLRFLDASKAKRDHLFADLVRFIWNTGLRLGEALYLRVGDIDFTKRMLYVTSRPEYPLKDREERRIPLNRVALGVARRRALGAKAEQLLLPSTKGDALHVCSASGQFKKRCRAAGVPEGNWYKLRHNFGSRMALRYPQHVTCLLMGHSSPTITAQYYVHQEIMKLPAPPAVGA